MDGRAANRPRCRALHRLAGSAVSGPGPGRAPHLRRQGHRAGQPAVVVLRHQPGVADPHPRRLRPARLVPAAGARRRSRPGRTQTPPLLPAAHRRRDGPPWPAAMAPPRRRLALGHRARRRVRARAHPAVANLTDTARFTGNRSTHHRAGQPDSTSSLGDPRPHDGGNHVHPTTAPNSLRRMPPNPPTERSGLSDPPAASRPAVAGWDAQAGPYRAPLPVPPPDARVVQDRPDVRRSLQPLQRRGRVERH